MTAENSMKPIDVALLIVLAIAAVLLSSTGCAVCRVQVQPIENGVRAMLINQPVADDQEALLLPKRWRAIIPVVGIVGGAVAVAENNDWFKGSKGHSSPAPIAAPSTSSSAPFAYFYGNGNTFQYHTEE